MHQPPPTAPASVPPLPVVADPPGYLVRADLRQLRAQRVHLAHGVSASPPNGPVSDCFIDGPAALSGRDSPKHAPSIVVDHDVDPFAHGASLHGMNWCGYDYTLGPRMATKSPQIPPYATPPASRARASVFGNPKCPRPSPMADIGVSAR